MRPLDRSLLVVLLALAACLATATGATSKAPDRPSPLPQTFTSLSSLYDDLANMRPDALQYYLEASTAKVEELASVGDGPKIFFYAQFAGRAASLLLASDLFHPPPGWSAVRADKDIRAIAGNFVSVSLSRRFINNEARTMSIELTFKTEDIAPLRAPNSGETLIKIGRYDALLRLRDGCAAVEFVVGRLTLRMSDVCEASDTAAGAAIRELARTFDVDRQAEAALSLLSEQSDRYIATYRSLQVSTQDALDGSLYRSNLPILLAAVRAGDRIAAIGAAFRIQAHSQPYNALRRCLPEKVKWIRGARAPEPRIACDMCSVTDSPPKLVQAKYRVERCHDEHSVCLSIESLAPGDPTARDDAGPDGRLDLPDKATEAFYKRRFRLSVYNLLTPQFGPRFLEQIDTQCLDQMPDLYLPQ